MASTPAPLPSLGLLDGLGTAPSGAVDSPAPLPSLGLLGGLGTAAVVASDPPFVWHDPVPSAFAADIGWQAIYAWTPLGVPPSNRGDIDSSEANLVATGGSGTFSGSASSPATVTVAVNGGAGTFSGTASSSSGSCPTTGQIVTAIMAHEIEPGVSVQLALRVILAAVSGPTAGLGTSTERYYDPDGLVARITATFDGDSNRTSVTLDDS